jgi:hypothetical protein
VSASWAYRRIAPAAANWNGLAPTAGRCFGLHHVRLYVVAASTA